ncbi:MAG: APC family permease [Bacillota bacterium]|nr:APC family permease [Bacillota bacterium]
MNTVLENTSTKVSTGLKENNLSFTEVIAQSVANIGPSVGPALGISTVYVSAGNGSWLTYVFATIAILFVGYHINQFARRSASPGALYTYVSDGLGAGAGFLSGWALVLAYILTGSACLAGLSNYTNELLGYVGLSLHPVAICVVATLVGWFMVYKDAQVSAKLMLILEAVSLTLIFTLGIIILAKNGFKIDFAQVKMKGVTADSLRLGLVMAFFSFVGFESATALGGEAKNPLRNIPRAVTISTIFVGLIFVSFSYIEILGFAATAKKLNEVPAPLTFLANTNGVGFMGVFLSLGAAISFWSCFVACITASGRILLSMGRHKILPATLARVHRTNNTPHVATGIVAVISFIIPAILLSKGCAGLDIFGWVGTVSTLGFLFCYAMIVISVPVFLYKRKELKAKNVIISTVSMGILLMPIIGSVYPLPPFPGVLFPFIFLAWLILGGSWFFIMDVYKHSVVEEMRKDIKLSREKVDFGEEIGGKLESN